MTEKEFNDKITDLKNEYDGLKRSALEAKGTDELNKISARRDEINTEKGRLFGIRQKEIGDRKRDFSAPISVSVNSDAENRGAALRKSNVPIRRKRNDRYKRAAITSAQAVLPAHTSNVIGEAPFITVSRLYENLNFINLNGGESFTYPYLKGYATAGTTAEGSDYNQSEPVFGYQKIGKEKITVYCEITEEVLKLSDADYEAFVRKEVTRALQRAIVKRVINGDTDGFVGVLDAKTGADVIPADTDLQIDALDNKTLRNIILSYGSTEDTEGAETLVLNKTDLRTLGLVEKTDKSFAYQLDSKNHTIDLVPYRVSADVPLYSGKKYFGFYGNIANYSVDVYSDVEIRRSTDYKFKQGMIAIKANVLCGGAPTAYCGLRRLKAPADASVGG